MDSCTKVRHRRIRPAIKGMVEVNPPMPITTVAPNSFKILWQHNKPLIDRKIKGTIAKENRRGIGTDCTRSKASCPYPSTASESIFFSEINNNTSCPRLRHTSATAIPGNKCPPVPPQAITIRSDIAIFWLLASGCYPPSPTHHSHACHLQSRTFDSPPNPFQSLDKWSRCHIVLLSDFQPDPELSWQPQILF